MAIDNLIADFNDHAGLPTAVFVIGEEYYYKAVFLRQNEGLYEEAKEYYRKTLAVWERIIMELPSCGIMIKYRCERCMIAPPHCTCEESGTGGACPRQIC